MPSFNVIARDFSLRAPDLLPVSRETIRHWLKGESMPHISRMQVLIDWLGAELIDFSLQCNRECRQEGFNRSCTDERLALCNMFEKLDQQETRAVMAVLHVLVAKHDLNALIETHS
jgi:predicted transcriptional regulator